MRREVRVDGERGRPGPGVALGVVYRGNGFVSYGRRSGRAVLQRFLLSFALGTAARWGILQKGSNVHRRRWMMTLNLGSGGGVGVVVLVVVVLQVVPVVVAVVGVVEVVLE